MNMERKDIAQARLNVDVECTLRSDEYRFEIGIYVFKEGEYYVAYAPALDLSTYSDEFNGVISAFYEAFQLYVEFCLENNTLRENLVELGWQIDKKVIKEPKVQRLMQNETVVDIFNGGFNYQYMRSPISIPTCAL